MTQVHIDPIRPSPLARVIHNAFGLHAMPLEGQQIMENLSLKEQLLSTQPLTFTHSFLPVRAPHMERSLQRAFQRQPRPTEMERGTCS